MEHIGHHVLITGGATGIGFALAKKFYTSGNRVIVVGRSEQNSLRLPVPCQASVRAQLMCRPSQIVNGLSPRIPTSPF